MDKQVKVVIEKFGKYLLIKREDNEKKEHKGNWECPGGKLKKGESFEEAAIREVKEETNLDVDIKKVIKDIRKDDEVHAVVFLANPKNTDIKLSSEHSDFRWFTYKELKNLENIIYKDFFLELVAISRKN
ncbi:NUDIX hydrolase [Candidatus Pacearchaeota archaeon]|nr:NUDIX hydrolase [Candidatus Pacearchaeota archaeon]